VKSLKIIFAVWDTGRAGGTRAIYEIGNRLSGKGHDVKIVALGGEHKWFNVRVPVEYVEVPFLLKPALGLYHLLFLTSKKVDYFSVNAFAKKLGFHADMVKALAHALKKCSNVDVSVATWYPTALAVSLSGVSKPYYFMQDFPELVLTGGEYGLRTFYITLRLPFHFLTNSTYTRDVVLNQQPNAEVTTIGAGVNTEVFYPRNSQIIDISNKRVIMIMLRGLKFKGDDIAVKALNIVNRKIPIHVLIVGSARALDKVKPEITFTYIHFGDMSDENLAKIYSSADTFVFTSYVEGFGLPPLEAMACGTPVVTTDCKGNRDYARDGYNCLVSPPGEPLAIAEQVLKVLSDDRLGEKLRNGGLETAKKWNWDVVVTNLEESLKEHN